ncbi:hypothetical protein FACS1894188_10230 [Clostridia bacterium]|nr:hypothetical protein FACS1894188_10230 [Clostridia bacterium]
MITKVFDTLKQLEGVSGVFFYYPETVAEFPCISFYEANNAPFKYADNAEYITEINIVVDVWVRTPEETRLISALVIKSMSGLDFVREYSRDLYDNGVHHRTNRLSETRSRDWQIKRHS